MSIRSLAFARSKCTRRVVLCMCGRSESGVGGVAA